MNNIKDPIIVYGISKGIVKKFKIFDNEKKGNQAQIFFRKLMNDPTIDSYHMMDIECFSNKLNDERT